MKMNVGHTQFKSNRGFTLVEIMISTCIFLISISGIVYSYLKCMELQDMGRNVTIATQAVKNKMEEIKSTSPVTIASTYNNTTFTATDINGIGAIYVTTPLTGLLLVKVVFCWRQPNGRLIGEDTNLNGVLNAGEDKNANAQLDSYVQMLTYIYM